MMIKLGKRRPKLAEEKPKRSCSGECKCEIFIMFAFIRWKRISTGNPRTWACAQTTLAAHTHTLLGVCPWQCCAGRPLANGGSWSGLCHHAAEQKEKQEWGWAQQDTKVVHTCSGSWQWRTISNAPGRKEERKEGEERRKDGNGREELRRQRGGSWADGR